MASTWCDLAAQTLHKGDAKLPGSLDEVNQAIQAQPGAATAHAVECDVRSDEQVENMVASALDRFGRYVANEVQGTALRVSAMLCQARFGSVQPWCNLLGYGGKHAREAA